jgi:xylulokinase
LFGLTLQHSRNDIARAFLEGVCFELRRCVEVLAEHHPVERVMVSGNITRAASSVQLLADILRRPVGMVTEKSPAAYGAALLARRIGRLGAGGDSSIEFKNPTATLATRYDMLYREYCEVAARCS